MRRSSAVISLVVAALVAGCAHKGSGSAAAPAYAAFKECSRKAATAMARTAQSPDAVVAKAIASCPREELALSQALSAAGNAPSLEELKANQVQELTAVVMVLRG